MVVYPRFATKKQKRRIRNFVTEWKSHIELPDIPILFTKSGKDTLGYYVDRNEIRVPQLAWDGNWHRMMWLAIAAHEVGHYNDDHRMSKEQRTQFFEAVTGSKVKGFHDFYGMEVPYGDSYWWFDAREDDANGWANKVGELYADCFVEAFTELKAHRGSDGLQVTPELVEMVRSWA
jgi:hypothetical protein